MSTKTNAERLIALHTRLTGAFPAVRGDEGYMELCLMALAPFPVELVEVVYREAALTPRFGSFAPSPGQLVALAEEVASLSGIKSAEAHAILWWNFIRAKHRDMREAGHTSLHSKYDAQAVQAVENCGGLVWILEGDGDKPRQAFVKTYLALEGRYQDAETRPLAAGEDYTTTKKPWRGRILKRAHQQAAIAVSGQESQIEYEGSQRDVGGLIRGLVGP